MKNKYIFKKRRNKALFSAVDYFGYSIKKVCKPDDKKPPSKVEKILIIRLAHIGDTLMTTPAIRALKEHYPDASITALVGSWCRDIMVGNPFIDRVITLDAPWHDRSTSLSSKRSLEVIKAIRLLREEKYDIGVQFVLDYHDNLLCGLAGCRYTIGYGVAGFGFMLSKTTSFSEIPCHDIEINLNLIRQLGAQTVSDSMELYPSSHDEEYIDNLLIQNDLKTSEFALIHPGVGENNRRWTNDGFAGVIEGLHHQHGIKSVICGGPGEIEKARAISEIASVPTVVIAGKTTLMELAALASRARICIGLESSFSHISVAMGAPVVSIFCGFTDTVRWQLIGDNAVTIMKKLPCSTSCIPDACPHRYCLTGITSEQVLATIKEQLSEEASSLIDIQGQPQNLKYV